MAPISSSRRSSPSSRSSASSSGSSSTSPLFTRTPLPIRRPTKYFPSQKYIAAAAEIVHFGVSRVPMVARVTIVDYRGTVILDTFVRPTQPVGDYRTSTAGLSSLHLATAPSFSDVQQWVSSVLKDKILIGYALWQFLSVMSLCHPAIDTRDIALFLPFRRSLGYAPNQTVPFVTLVNNLMARNIGSHGEVAVEQARAAMDLFRSCESIWESIVKSGSWPCALPPCSQGGCFS